MAISDFPTAPSRQDPTTFADRADATLGHLPTFVTEINSFIDDINGSGSVIQVAYQEFTESGFFSVPVGSNFVYIEAIGAGAGGGRKLGTTDTVGVWGGGGGAFAAALFRAEELEGLNASIRITIGAGGAGGPAGGNTNGEDGGDTIVDNAVTISTYEDVLIAPGGKAAPSQKSNDHEADIGGSNRADRGSRGGGGEVTMIFGPSGGAGQGGFSSGSGGFGMGDGGDCVMGGAGGGGAYSDKKYAPGISQYGGNGGGVGAGGLNGTAPGGGGGAESGTGSGGNGANGRVRIWAW